MSDPEEFSNHIRIHAIRKRDGKRGVTYVARWRVGGKDRQSTFPTAKLADGFRSKLMISAQAGEPFNLVTGLPPSMTPKSVEVTWMDHCVDFVQMKWPDAAPKYRKSLAESLTNLTVPLIPSNGRPYDTTELRRALYRWVFAVPNPREEPPDELREVVSWLHSHSVPIAELADPTIVRKVLAAVSVKLDGGRASNATIAQRRSAFHNCLEYAVERGRLTTNPLAEVKRKRLPPAPAIDRRRVANPTQARRLLAEVAEEDPELEAYFATMYYAGTRPGEAVNLRHRDCTLPREGWGQLLLSSSYQRAGATWSESNDPGEERQLKHRARQDTRPVPAPPALVAILRQHIATYELGPDGRLFVNRTGIVGRPMSPPYDKPVSPNTTYRAWHRARAAALTTDQFNSPLAQRPYDLRHACLSTWLNAGVAPVQVAEWAGHGVAVLLSTYAKCIDGQESLALERIQNVLSKDDE